MEALAKRKIRMDESVLDGRVAVLLPLNEAEFSDRDFAINESILIYMEEHEKAPSPVELMDIMNTNKLSDVYLELEHLQDIGVIGYAPKMPNPIVIVRGMWVGLCKSICGCDCRIFQGWHSDTKELRVEG